MKTYIRKININAKTKYTNRNPAITRICLSDYNPHQADIARNFVETLSGNFYTVSYDVITMTYEIEERHNR